MAILKNTSSPFMLSGEIYLENQILKKIQTENVFDIENNYITPIKYKGAKEPIFIVENDYILQPLGNTSFVAIDALSNLTITLPQIQENSDSLLFLLKRIDFSDFLVKIKPNSVSEVIEEEQQEYFIYNNGTTLVIINKDNKWYVL